MGMFPFCRKALESFFSSDLEATLDKDLALEDKSGSSTFYVDLVDHK